MKSQINTRRSILGLMSVLLILIFASVVNAQEDVAEPQIGYYVADDADGVQQIYQQLLAGQSQPRQITSAESDVITFGVAYDGLSVAYISNGQLWLQPIHTEQAEALTTVSDDQFFAGPVYSPDGEYIAYADHGVWLLKLSTRETTHILKEVLFNDAEPNPDAYRVYLPERFVLDADGKSAQLIVDVGLRDWNSVSVYDLATDEFKLLEGFEYTSLLPLSDGRALLYGNPAVEPTIGITGLEDINDHSLLLSFSELSDDPNTAFYPSALVEIEPGIVRVIGTVIQFGTTTASGMTLFSFDLDVDSGEVEDVHLYPVSDGNEVGREEMGQLSQDGRLIPMYENALSTDFGTIYGDLHLIDLATGEATTDTFPETVGIFHFQPQLVD